MAGIGGWVTSLLGTGSPAGTVTPTSPRRGTVINSLRNDVILLGGLRHQYDLDRGGRLTELFPAVADTYEDHPEWRDATLDFDKLRGDDSGLLWVVQFLIHRRCENAATTVTPRIVLAGTSTLVKAGTVHNTTSWSTETLTLSSGEVQSYTGLKTVRLQVKRSDLVYPVFCCAELLTYAPEPVA